LFWGEESDGSIKRICARSGIDQCDKWGLGKKGCACGNIDESKDAEAFPFCFSDLNQGAEGFRVAEGWELGRRWWRGSWRGANS